MDQSIAGLREHYAAGKLHETDVTPDPVSQFKVWWNEAIISQVPEPNAMTLATASSDGMPSARIVLLKDIDENGFVFFTNYDSYKGMQLEENPKACLVFLWKELERQVRITGLVSKVEENDSDAYFQSRPRGSQLGAIASPQSKVIRNREWLDQRYEEMETEYKNKKMYRPANWGGYCVKPVVVEFWQGRPSRLHDRLQYSLTENGAWQIERLAP